MSPERRAAGLIVGILAVVILLLAMTQMVYVVDERELAVVLQFGDPVAVREESGLYFKYPWIQQVERLPRPRQFWELPGAGGLRDTQTQDGERVNITPWAVWRITDAQRFIQQFRTVDRGQARVEEVVRSTIRDVVSRHRRYELIRSTDRELAVTFGFEDVTEEEKQEILEEAGEDLLAAVEAKVRVGRERMLEMILAESRERLAETIGVEKEGDVIELVDVGITRIEFNDSVLQSLFARQIARMEAIAARHEKEGEREAAKIVNQAKADAEAIIGEGEKRKEETLGGIRAYEIEQDAVALQQMGEFYFFVRQLEALRKGLAQNARIILTTDNEFFDLMRGLDGRGSWELPPSSERAGPVPAVVPPMSTDPDVAGSE